MTGPVLVMAHVVAFLLVIVVPVRSWRSYRRLQRLGHELDPIRRHQKLRASVIVKWVLTADVLLVWRIGSPDTMPVLMASSWWWWIVGEIVVLAAVCAVVIPIRLRTPAYRARSAKAATRIASLVPRTRQERRFIVVVAITAGVTEEVVYRAFLLPYLAWLAPGRSMLGVVAIGSVIFGLAHAYQGWRGVLQTTALGFVFSGIYLASGLALPIILHTVIDLGLLLLPTDLLNEDGTAPTHDDLALTSSGSGHTPAPGG